MNDDASVCVLTAGSQKQEIRLGAGSNLHCFSNLKPNTEYKISVYAQLQDGTEGPAATATVKTCEATPTFTCKTAAMPPREVTFTPRANRLWLCCIFKLLKLGFIESAWNMGKENLAVQQTRNLVRY